MILRVDCPEEGQVFEQWARQTGLDVDALGNQGCGCCVDIYTLTVPTRAAAELDRLLGEVDNGVTHLPPST